METAQVTFSFVATFFESCKKSIGHKQKLECLRSFRRSVEAHCVGDVHFIYRLLVPQLDKGRANFLLKETRLAVVLGLALNLDQAHSQSAKIAKMWRSFEAGSFPAVAEKSLLATRCGVLEGMPGIHKLTVKSLNAALDDLASADSNAKKARVLAALVAQTTARQMRWILQIILGELKLGLGDMVILRELHPSACAAYSVTMSLQAATASITNGCTAAALLAMKPGNPILPQLARKVATPQDVAKVHGEGKAVVVELKFDGERMQVHKAGDTVQFFSRRGLEHGHLSSYNVLDDVVKAHVPHKSIILDGEVVVFNRTRGKCEPFGGMRSAVVAARDGRPGDASVSMAGCMGLYTGDPDYDHPQVEELELLYVAFDILYLDGRCVADQPLHERHRLLDRAVLDSMAVPVGKGGMVGRVLKMLPGRVALAGRPISHICSTREALEAIFKECIEQQEEGLIVKDPDSPWRPGDRSAAWLKLKVDYAHSQDIDALIIGAFFGTGRNGGQLTEFLLGLTESKRIQGVEEAPPNFASFCKVGIGFKHDELEVLRDALHGNVLPPGSARPSCYRVTGHPKERPDLWVRDPWKSVVLQVQGESRPISTSIYATRLSIRFPRALRIRWDKPPAAVQTEAELWAEVEARRARLLAGGGPCTCSKCCAGNKRGYSRKRAQADGEAAAATAVVPHLRPAAQPGSVRCHSTIFEGLRFFFANHGTLGKRELEETVLRLGGQVYQNWTPQVTHTLAADRGLGFAARVRAGQDVIGTAWLQECDQCCAMVPLRPYHYLHLTKESLCSMAGVDCFGDSFREDVTPEQIKAILDNHVEVKDLDTGQLLEDFEWEAGREPIPGHQAGVDSMAKKRRLCNVVHKALAAAPGTPCRRSGLSDAHICFFPACEEYCTTAAVDCCFPKADLMARTCLAARIATGRHESDRICLLCMGQDLQMESGCSCGDRMSPALGCSMQLAHKATASIPAAVQECSFPRSSACCMPLPQYGLDKIIVKRSELQARMLGGCVQDTISEATTHIVLIPPLSGSACHCSMLPAAASLRGSGLSDSIMRRHASGKLQLVCLSWLELAVASKAWPPEENMRQSIDLNLKEYAIVCKL